MQNVLNESDLNVNSSELVAIKFSAVWCQPCKVFAKTVSKMENEFSNIKFYSVDIDQVPEIAAKYRVMSLPTTVLVKNGQEVNRIVGMSIAEATRKVFKNFAGPISG